MALWQWRPRHPATSRADRAARRAPACRCAASSQSRPDSSRPMSPRKRLITKPTTALLLGGRQQFQRTDQMGENTAPVDVGHQDHRAIHGLGKAHVGDVAVAQVDLGRATRRPRPARSRRLPSAAPRIPAPHPSPAACTRGNPGHSRSAATWPWMMTCAFLSVVGFNSTGLKSVCGGSPQASACSACARPISPPSTVTAELSAMFCGLNGATFIPRRFRMRHSAATSVDLPASEVVP